MKFSISGDYVTKEARAMYWEDKEKFEVVKDYLLNFLVCDLSDEELEEIIISIIEGRKKLVGINEFDLEDDPDCEVKTITENTNKIREGEILRKIKEDMQSNIKNYIDYYACDKSWAFFKGINPTDAYEYAYTDPYYIARLMQDPELPVLAIDCKVYPIEKLNVSHFTDDSVKDILDHGAYLVNKPELVEELMGKTVNGGNVFEFYEKLYEYWENSEHKDHPRVIERQKRYLRAKKFHECVKKETPKPKKIEEITGLPDKEITSVYGIIDREGNWYNCKWGGHAQVALHIVKNNKARFGLPEDEEIDMHKALDLIIEKGYVLIRDVNNCEPMLYYKEYMRPNSYQEEKIEDYKEHFEIDELEYQTRYYF